MITHKPKEERRLRYKALKAIGFNYSWRQAMRDWQDYKIRRHIHRLIGEVRE
jgi:hypothetical protein